MEKQELIEHCNKQIKNCKAFNDFKHLEEHQLMLDIINTNDNLNKGIDELIKKYEKEVYELSNDFCGTPLDYYRSPIYEKVIQDLEKLKGE